MVISGSSGISISSLRFEEVSNAGSFFRLVASIVFGCDCRGSVTQMALSVVDSIFVRHQGAHHFAQSMNRLCVFDPFAA